MGEEASRAERLRARRRAEARRSLELSRRAAELARKAAETSTRIAAAQEKSARLMGRELPTDSRAADAHRRSAACQRAAAQLHDNYVRQLERWVNREVAQREARPVFMSAVARVAGWQGAALTLVTGDGDEGMVAASDPAVRAAHELEIALAEGPSWDALRDQSISLAGGPELEDRWPRYGAAVRDLGVLSVASAPIHFGGRCGGCMTLLDLGPTTSRHGVRRLAEVAEGLATVLRTSDPSPSGGEGPLALKLFEQEDFQPSLNAAAGVLHELNGYSMADAVALIRAHAFAEDQTVSEVADAVIRRGGSLDDQRQ